MSFNELKVNLNVVKNYIFVNEREMVGGGRQGWSNAIKMSDLLMVTEEGRGKENFC